MNLYGLIGKPLGHSFSQKYFTEKFQNEGINAKYELFPLDTIEQVEELIRSNPDLCGFNVTIPYKQQIIKYLDSIDAEAEAVGAVNVVKILRDGSAIRLKGYNSDIYGFYESIKPLLKPHHRKALILGTGGASKAVASMLTKLEIEYQYVTRTPKANMLTYSMLDEKIMSEHTVIVNASPVGMSPEVDKCPDIPYQYLSDAHLTYDLIYNPLQTLFLAKAEKQGAATKNGLEMLHLQAEKAWEIWQND